MPKWREECTGNTREQSERDEYQRKSQHEHERVHENARTITLGHPVTQMGLGYTTYEAQIRGNERERARRKEHQHPCKEC
jgi:hypothetical protein